MEEKEKKHNVSLTGIILLSVGVILLLYVAFIFGYLVATDPTLKVNAQTDTLKIDRVLLNSKSSITLDISSFTNELQKVEIIRNGDSSDYVIITSTQK